MVEKRQEKIITAFGSNVKEIRIKKNLTQLDLAAQLEIDIRQIQRIENAEINTSITMAYLLAEALEVPVSKLFDF